MIEKKYDDVFSFERLYAAHIRGRLSKRDKKPIVKFEINFLENLANLHNELSERKFYIKRYHSFIVFEPKKREIQTLDYRVRIVQHILCDDVLEPYFSSRAILDNCVCQKGKGLQFALKRFEKMLRQHIKNNKDEGWVLKCDVKKYFASIPHETLKTLICGEIKDKDLRKLVEDVIDSYHTNPDFLARYSIPPLCEVRESKNHVTMVTQTKAEDERRSEKNTHSGKPTGQIKATKIICTGRGIPIGNQTSQIFGMFYLNSLDRLIKEKLRIKIYSRYMDDFILVHKDKKVLQNALKEIEKKMEELGLFLNSKTQIFPLKNGIKYLGFRYTITPTGKLVKQVVKKTRKRMIWRVKLLKRAYADGTIDKKRIKASMCAFHGHLSHANCFTLEKSLKDKLKKELNEDFDSS